MARGLGSALLALFVGGSIWLLSLRNGIVVENLVSPQDPHPGICDPFAEPGFLHYNPEVPKRARWIPFSATCEPAPDYISLFEKRDAVALSFLANRTILILGDSVDRNGLEHFATMLGLDRYSVPYHDAKLKGFEPDGWDVRGLPWVVRCDWLDLTFTNGFLYGLDDEDNFRAQPDWHAPGLAEERISKLVKVHTDQLKYPPSFISLHSGLWDLAFFGRKDRSASLSTEISLSHERIMWWQRRMKKVIQHVELTFPGVPLWYRKLHRVGPVGGASYDWRHATKASEDDPNVKPETFSNFFTDVRIHQIREMQQQVVVSEGIPSFDFGEMWEGWQSYQQMVHPLLYPGGPVFGQGLIHHIWMESQGRENWALSKTRKLAPLITPVVDEL